MTHTYLKKEDDEYAVGQWLINREGYHHFVTMFEVRNIWLAFKAVNALNGGLSVNPESLFLKEK